MTMPLKTVPWDVAEHLDTPEAISDYLEAVFEIGDPQLIVAALGDVARARGMTALARDSGLSRESLYKALAKEGNPEFSTVVKVVNSLGLRLAAIALAPAKRKGAARTAKKAPVAKTRSARRQSKYA
jgi:probable addiction module antidote protein